MKLKNENSNIMELLKEQTIPNETETAMIEEIINNENTLFLLAAKCFALGEIIGKRKERSRRLKNNKFSGLTPADQDDRINLTTKEVMVKKIEQSLYKDDKLLKIVYNMISSYQN